MNNNIKTSGGIFTQHFIETLEQDRVSHPALKPETFIFPYQKRIGERELEGNISKAWESLVERWDVIERDFAALDISTLRQRWIRPLFSALGFNLEFNRSDITLEEDKRYPISYFGRCGTTEQVVPIHSVLYHDEGSLETKLAPGRGVKNAAPHDMLQSFLNLSKEHSWGLLTDGISLRLLRDFYHSYTRGYVEFDLKGIFDSRDFAGFRAMYRLLHASRFYRPPGQEAAPIDALYEDSLSQGVAVGSKLRENVQAAIEQFAEGFLVSSPGFLQQLQAQAEAQPNGAQQLYQNILVTIYRILFLLFAEQRGMLPGRGSLYHEEYSLTALRTLAERPQGEDHHFDLWEKLKVTFSMVEHGAPQLRIFAYNGALFSAARTPLLMPEGIAEAPRCRNDYLLTAIRHLTTVEQDKVLQRISYSDLSVEEIGSIYESLLDITPRISTSPMMINGREIPANTFFLDPRGMGRKTTGSYYTPPSLVNELIKSALEPVLLERLGQAVPGYESDLVDALKPEEAQRAEAALLAIKVVDPACGSGAFLIAADNRLGLELARIRERSQFPSDSTLRHARRDVLAHCIHGVDLNPMAVELCTVSLWINAAVEDAPLNFLDHHIQCGNSLVGATPELLHQGIPDEAYTPVSGDDKNYARGLKSQNRTERKGQGRLPLKFTIISDPAELSAYIQVRDLAEDQPAQAEQLYRSLQASPDYWDQRLPYDLWCAAFFTPLRSGEAIPTSYDVWQAQANPKLVPEQLRQAARSLAEQQHFFHWHLAFPEVFDAAGKGGFDVVLGNPPWELINLEEKEFFEGKDEAIVNAQTGAERKRLIEQLQQSNPPLYQAYRAALFEAEALAKFLQSSGNFPLSSSGRINLYSVFAEKDRSLISLIGRAGIIVPTGLATDFTNREFFADLIKSKQIGSLFDFENRKGIFQNVHRSYKFSLLTIRGIKSNDKTNAKFAFFLHSTDDLKNEEKVFELDSTDFELLNPNTRTCPIFRTRSDADLTRKLYRKAPVLVNEVTGENPWGISFKQGHFNMTSDSHLFHTKEQLESLGFKLQGNIFIKGSEVYLPLYEAKMFWFYDHRFGTYEGVVDRSDTHLHEIPSRDPDYYALPWYWVSGNDWKLTIPQEYYLAFRNVTNVTNERSAVSAILPMVAIGHSAPFLIFNIRGFEALLLANISSFTFDYLSRQKIGGVNLTFHYVKQLPVYPKNKYTQQLIDHFLIKVLELVYTSFDLYPFFEKQFQSLSPETRKYLLDQWRNEDLMVNRSRIDSSYLNIYGLLQLDNNKTKEIEIRYPFSWDEERRFQLRCDLDALFGHLYNLTRDEFAYILETFPIVRRKDEAQFGEYRTKRVILEKFDALADDPMLVGACTPLAERVSVLRPSAQPILPDSEAELIEAEEPAAQPEPVPAQPRASAEPEPPAAPAAAPAAKEQQSLPFSSQADSPMISDYTLYRCPICDKHILGFDLERHTREVHLGKDPGYKKIRK